VLLLLLEKFNVQLLTSYVKMRKIIILLAVIMSFTAVSHAQEAETEPEALNDKYQFLKRRSNSWENFKVIRETSLDALWRNVQDSVRVLKSDLATSKIKISEQQVLIDGHQGEMNKLKSSLAESEYRNSRISLLGVYIMQNIYTSMVWGIIGLLLMLLIIGYLRFRSNERTTRKKVKDYEELSEEFEEYRKIVRQREIRIKRELQTASNKLEEIKHRASSR
jgi:hypothetical protein